MKRRRRGYTLLEVAIVVTILSMVVVLATTTLTTLFRIERQFAGDAAQSQTIARLASQLRTDAHAAISTTTAEGCELALADGRTIRLAFASPAVTREVFRGDKIEHRDAFLLPRSATATFSSLPQDRGQLIRLTIAPKEGVPSSRAPPVRSLAIEVAVNVQGRTLNEGGPP
jgi:prepilin-type N-terminal cleavage/methylation domain-containing protein